MESATHSLLEPLGKGDDGRGDENDLEPEHEMREVLEQQENSISVRAPNSPRLRPRSTAQMINHTCERE
jgi:hypothetical protein